MRSLLVRLLPRLGPLGQGAGIVMPLAGLVAAALLAVGATVYFSSVKEDALQQASEERVVASSLRTLGRTLANGVRDYGWWDDAVQCLVLALDIDWADTNIGPGLADSLGVGLSLVIDGADRVVYGQLDGARIEHDALSRFGGGLLRLATKARSNQGAIPASESAVLEGADGLFAVAAGRLVPQTAAVSLPDGPGSILIFGKRLDDTFLHDLAEDFGLAALSFAKDAPASGLAGVVLRGPDGESVRRIVWQPQRPGRSQLAWLGPGLLASLLVFCGFTAVALGNIGRATAAIQDSEARFKDIAEAASDWIWETDRELRLTYVSDHGLRMTGLPAADLLGRPLHEVLLPTDGEHRHLQPTALAARQPFRDVLCRLHTAAEAFRVLRVAGKPVLDAKGGFCGYRGTATDITAETAAIEQARFLAEHDALTGLPNRLLLHERLDEMLRRCRRYGIKGAVLCLGLDRFKELNDSLGHAAGDMLLTACAERLRSCTRATDVVARLGGDEFAVVQSDIGGIGDVEQLCERIIAALGEPFRLGDQEVTASVSLGVALAPADGDDPAKLLQNADIALCRAKGTGRRQVCFFEAGMDEQLRERKRLEAELRLALADGQLEVHYQPQVKARTGELLGAEALIRWRHPEGGMIPPGVFVPLAEETGLIVPIGEWVMRTACKDAAGWPGLRVSVNLSPVQFKQRDLLAVMTRALADAGLPPERLEVEITESLLLQDTAEALAVLDRLRALGVKIAMDDFGTGYSSLSYLQKFPFDKIKIDRSFVAGLEDRADRQAIIRAIVHLGQNLGMSICAEGVETQGQLALLQVEGCEEVQGFLFGRPVPLAGIAARLAHGREASSHRACSPSRGDIRTAAGTSALLAG